MADTKGPEIRVDKLKDDNDNYVKLLRGFKQEFSFLALNQAFNKLEKSKQFARNSSLFILLFLAVIIVYIPYFYLLIICIVLAVRNFLYYSFTCNKTC